MQQNARLLVVDDNLEIHHDFKKVLCSQKNETEVDEMRALLFGDAETSDAKKIVTPKFQIDSAYQGEEGFELVKAAKLNNNPYALAFIDMRMPPGWDGVQTIEKIWTVDEDLQIVICTAYSDYSFDEIYTRLNGSDNFLILKKPFDVVEIRQLASTLTKKWELTNQSRLHIDKQRLKIEESETKLQMNYNELKDLYQQLQFTQGQLVQHSKLIAIGQLAAGVAHEINNPIAFVTSNTQSLQGYIKTIEEILQFFDDKLNNASSDSISQIKETWENLATEKNLSFIREDMNILLSECLDGLGRVKEIVSDLKSFSHTDEGEMQKSDINQCIDLTLKMIMNELKYKCEVKKEYSELPLIWCNPRQLNQVFMNLIVNASQAISDKGQITLKTSTDQGMIRIDITDTGEGIPPENIDKLFDPFFTTKPVGKGTGLGLSISYNIIQKHNGRIEVSSELSKGTTFTISLPIENAA